jgi:HEAT repeat protein
MTPHPPAPELGEKFFQPASFLAFVFLLLAIIGGGLYYFAPSRGARTSTNDFRETGELFQAARIASLSEVEVSRAIELTESPDPLARSRAIVVLEVDGRRSPATRTKAIPVLCEKLKDDEPVVRGHAITALGELDARDRANAIKPFAASKLPDEQLRARKALRKLGADLEQLAKELGVDWKDLDDE